MGIEAGQRSPPGFNLGRRAGRTRGGRRRTRDRNAVGRQNEKTDLVPCGGGVERCTDHYVEHWYRKSRRCGPNPADRTLPGLSLLHSASLSLSPLCFVPSCPWDTWSVRSTIPLSLTSQSSGFNSICVSRENFSFWSVCIFPAVDSVTHCGLTRKKKGLYSGCDTWTVLSGNVGGQFRQQLEPAWTFSDRFSQSSVQVQQVHFTCGC